MTELRKPINTSLYETMELYYELFVLFQDKTYTNVSLEQGNQCINPIHFTPLSIENIKNTHL